MNPRLLAASLAVGLLAPVAALAAQPLAPASAVSAVTVYTDRAVVTRHASLDLAANWLTRKPTRAS